MPVTKKRTDLYKTEEGAHILRELRAMVADSKYNTGSTYSSDVSTYADHKIPFTDKHMQYLIAHPSVDAEQYLSNLRLMTRVR